MKTRIIFIIIIYINSQSNPTIIILFFQIIITLQCQRSWRKTPSSFQNRWISFRSTADDTDYIFQGAIILFSLHWLGKKLFLSLLVHSALTDCNLPPIIIIPYNAIPLPNDPVSHWRIKSSFKEIINFFDIECSNSFFLERKKSVAVKEFAKKICSKKANKKIAEKMCEIYASVRSFLFSPPFFVLYLVELWTKIILLKEKNHPALQEKRLLPKNFEKKENPKKKRIHPVKRPKKYSKTKQKNTTIFVLYTTTITTQKMLRFRSHYELSYFSWIMK